MKSKASHDVLLLCPKCHQRSNMFDMNLRRKLSDECDAPLNDAKSKFFERPELKLVITIFIKLNVLFSMVTEQLDY